MPASEVHPTGETGVAGRGRDPPTRPIAEAGHAQPGGGAASPPDVTAGAAYLGRSEAGGARFAFVFFSSREMSQVAAEIACSSTGGKGGLRKRDTEE